MGAREDQIMQVEPATARRNAGVELLSGRLPASAAGEIQMLKERVRV